MFTNTAKTNGVMRGRRTVLRGGKHVAIRFIWRRLVIPSCDSLLLVMLKAHRIAYRARPSASFLMHFGR